MSSKCVRLHHFAPKFQKFPGGACPPNPLAQASCARQISHSLLQIGLERSVVGAQGRYSRHLQKTERRYQWQPVDSWPKVDQSTVIPQNIDRNQHSQNPRIWPLWSNWSYLFRLSLPSPSFGHHGRTVRILALLLLTCNSKNSTKQNEHHLCTN